MSKSSKVWSIDQDARLLESRDRVLRKVLVSEYTPEDERAYLPVGYVIEHSEDWKMYQVHDSGFESSTNLVPRVVLDTVSLSHLEGELLTVIDASFADKTQREAIKSLIRNTVWKFNARKERELIEMFKVA